MCWCTPSLRTPFCGKPGCARPVPVQSLPKEQLGSAYARFVNRLFAKRNRGPDGLLHAAIGIGGEGGEIVDIVKKHWVYEKPLDREHLVEEIGDLMFYVQALCNQLGISISEACAANIDKLNKRYPSGYSDAAAIARADKS